MKLSIVIVSFNVRYFLDQTISSILESKTDFDFEIIVVDNGSIDDSVEWVQDHYPEVQVLESGENVGFARANNLGAGASAGEYLMLLNPDTILRNDTLQKCIDFIDRKARAGAIGVKMYDGQGNYLPESMRGFPGPWTSFCKITGLNEVFRKSKLFNYYYLGHLSADENQQVDVLTGACILVRRKLYQSLGGLDEEFFMYGEDIDLCYRLHEKGYQNYFLANTSIIHFKGESTSKNTVQYIRTFYRAMSIYAKKHYSKSVFAIMDWLIQGAILGRAGFAILLQKVKRQKAFILDVLLSVVFLFLWGVGENWNPPSASNLGWISIGLSIPVFWSLSGAYRIGKWWPFAKSSIFLGFVFLGALFPTVGWEGTFPFMVLVSLLFVIKLAWIRMSRGFVFLPFLTKGKDIRLFCAPKRVKVILKLLDFLPQIPGKVELVDNPGDPSVSSVDELIFDPTFITWTRIVDLIKENKGKDIRILSRDHRSLIAVLSKNESGLLIRREWKMSQDREMRAGETGATDHFLAMVLFFIAPVVAPKDITYWWSQCWKVVRGEKEWFGCIDQPTEGGDDYVFCYPLPSNTKVPHFLACELVQTHFTMGEKFSTLYHRMRSPKEQQ